MCLFDRTKYPIMCFVAPDSGDFCEMVGLQFACPGFESENETNPPLDRFEYFSFRKFSSGVQNERFRKMEIDDFVLAYWIRFVAKT